MQKKIGERIKFLINYDPKKLITEQVVSDDPKTNALGLVKASDKSDRNSLGYALGRDPNIYPNYCRYKDKAVNPGKNRFGVSGVEAIPTDDEGKIIYCAYKCPPVMKYSDEPDVIFIPNNAEIKFFNLGIVSTTVDDILQEYKNNPNLSDRTILSKNIMKIFLPDYVFWFKNSEGEKYQATIVYQKELRSWVFYGYKNLSTGEYYKQPVWKDSRNAGQKFIDEWGVPLSFAAAAITTILTFYNVGGNAILLAEILAEAGVGTALAVRNWQKGQTVMAWTDLITGLLPMLKLKGFFRGVSKSQIELLSKNMIDKGIDYWKSEPDAILDFYKQLGPTEQKTFQKIFYFDPISREKLLKGITEIIEDPKFFVKEVQSILKQDPKILTKLKFVDKLWARELTTGGAVQIIGTLFHIFTDRPLTNEEKKKIGDIYSSIPEEHRKEFMENVVKDLESGNKLNNLLKNRDTKVNTGWF
jgi:hypothetical protein